MILVDPRSGAESADKPTTVDRLVAYVRAIGVKCEKSSLEFADVAFEGNGPDGKILVGIERKTLHDCLHCIDDGRLAAHQLPGMRLMYAVRVLALEGCWKPHDQTGNLMESQNGCNYYECRYRSRTTLYAKLYRYLLSVALSGVIITYPRNLYETAYNCCEIYHYFQKPWDQHTSLLQTQTLAIPDMRVKPPLVRRWAADIEGIGVKGSMEAEQIFRRPIVLAKATEMDWMRLPRVGVATAQKIVREIYGV